jgi:uncharacterized protein
MHGVGLRTEHYATALESGLRLPLVEAISENFMLRGGRPLAVLERVRRDAAVALHGVALSVGGADPLSTGYLQALKQLKARIAACWVSDHLCFGTAGGHAGHDLWPLAFTEEMVEHVAARIRQVQDVLGERLLIENVSAYIGYAASRLTEWEFLCAVVERADCGVLLDINNIYVNAVNFGFDPHAYLRAIPSRRIGQLHLAGHSDCGTHLFDNHGSEVSEPVWQLFEACVRLHGPKPTVIEWDENVPSLERLLAESATAQRRESQVVAT